MVTAGLAGYAEEAVAARMAHLQNRLAERIPDIWFATQEQAKSFDDWVDEEARKKLRTVGAVTPK